MEPSIHSLLIILITLISIMLVIVLAGSIALAISIRRLLAKLHTIVDSSSESVGMLKQQLTRKVGLVTVARFLIRRFK